MAVHIDQVNGSNQPERDQLIVIRDGSNDDVPRTNKEIKEIADPQNQQQQFMTFRDEQHHSSELESKEKLHQVHTSEDTSGEQKSPTFIVEPKKKVTLVDSQSDG